jgi:hypothetical protein
MHAASLKTGRTTLLKLSRAIMHVSIAPPSGFRVIIPIDSDGCKPQSAIRGRTLNVERSGSPIRETAAPAP